MEHWFSWLLTFIATHCLLQSYAAGQSQSISTCTEHILVAAPLSYDPQSREGHLLRVEKRTVSQCRDLCLDNGQCHGLLHFTASGLCVLFGEGQARQSLAQLFQTTSFVKKCEGAEAGDDQAFPKPTTPRQTAPDANQEQHSGIYSNKGINTISVRRYSVHPANFLLYLYGIVSCLAGIVLLLFGLWVYRYTRKKILKQTEGAAGQEADMAFNIEFPDFLLPGSSRGSSSWRRKKKKKKKKKRRRRSRGGESSVSSTGSGTTALTSQSAATSGVSSAVPTLVNEAAEAVGGEVYKVRSHVWDKQKAYVIRGQDSSSYMIETPSTTDVASSVGTDLMSDTGSLASSVDSGFRRNVHTDSYGVASLG